MTFDATLFAAKQEVIQAALQVISSSHWADNHPEDPHHADSQDLANDALEDALTNWSELHRRDADLQIEFYRDGNGEHRWRAKSKANGNTLADSGEGYKRKIDIEQQVDKIFGSHVAKAWV